MTALRWLAVFALVGCGTSQSAGPKGDNGAAASANVPAGPKVDLARCDEAGKRAQTMDTDGNGKPDVWKLYAPGGSAEVLTCKKVDLNHDGRVDEIVVYDDQGNRQLEMFDLDFDGKWDVTVYYAGNQRVREELDTNYDGKSDIWKFYENDRLVRVELDRNYDGKVDQWEYFENGKLDRIGYDVSGSGKIEKWDRQPSETSVPEGASPAAASAPAKSDDAAPAPAEPAKDDKATDGTPPTAPKSAAKKK